MVEMTEAAAILNAATDRSLVLMDEIGRGTSTFDGMALAAAIARELVEKNRSMTLFATHYFELTQLADQHPEIANVHVAAAEAERQSRVPARSARRAGESKLRAGGRAARGRVERSR